MCQAVDGFANRIDAFFGDDIIEEERRQSELRVKPRVKWANGEGWRFSLPVRVNLALPQMEERWNVFLDSVMDDDEPDGGTDLKSDLAESLKVRDREAAVGLRYTIASKMKRTASLSVGMKIRSGELDPFVAMRFRYTIPMDLWRADLTQWFFWRRLEGLGETSRVEFRRPWDEKFEFLSSSSATWSESSEGMDLSQSFTFRRMLSATDAIAFRTRADAHTHPSAFVDIYTLGVDYRRLVYRDWVFLNVSPELRFPKDDDFNLTPAATVSVESYF